jgi:voltage-gated potassium channel
MGEGRVLCVLLLLCSVSGLGYLRATLATFFVGQDAGDASAELAGQHSIDALRAELRGRELRPRPRRDSPG